ncbi:MAG TPA: hypothetical protein ENF36_00645 [Desulfobacteraceae bacterium]|nr:hypothetical protein [Desulfobacteraceae bacterium]
MENYKHRLRDISIVLSIVFINASQFLIQSISYRGDLLVLDISIINNVTTQSSGVHACPPRLYRDRRVLRINPPKVWRINVKILFYEPAMTYRLQLRMKSQKSVVGPDKSG